MQAVTVGGIFKVVADFSADLPDVEAAIPVITKVITAVQAGQLPALTPDEINLAVKLERDLTKLVTDVKAL